MAVQSKTKPIYDEDLLALGENVRAEVVNGELIVQMTPNKGEHGECGAQILLFLATFIRARGLGHVFSDMTAFKLEEGEEGSIKGARVPDAAFVSYERLPEDASTNIILALAPDLAVEVISESEAYTEVLDKTADYLNHGVQMVWHVVPRRREVRVFTPENREGVTLNDQGVLVGGDVLPGFAVPVRAIFDHADSALHVEVLRKLLEG